MFNPIALLNDKIKNKIKKTKMYKPMINNFTSSLIDLNNVLEFGK